MKKPDKETSKDRIRDYITKKIDSYLYEYNLPIELNNDLVKLRNDFTNFVKTILAEQNTKEKYGVDIDYINSNISRINLEEATNPYFLKGTIIEERPPGPTNQEIEALVHTIYSIFSDVKTIDAVERIHLMDDLVNEIKKTFFLPNQNIPFTNRLYDRSINSYPQSNQNIPCEICSENRTVDICHIIPAMYGGSKNVVNILYLCPTHHRLFDRCMLIEDEWNNINFLNKSRVSCNYAYYVLLPKFKVFWSKLENGNNEKNSVYDIIISDHEKLKFRTEAIDDIINLITENPGITIETINTKSPMDLNFVRNAITDLKKQNCIKEKRKMGDRIFFPYNQ